MMANAEAVDPVQRKNAIMRSRELRKGNIILIIRLLGSLADISELEWVLLRFVLMMNCGDRWMDSVRSLISILITVA